MSERDRLLVPGETCWRVERANRLALIIDAADYFRFAKAAMLEAKHRIMLIGWDFDTRIKFEPGTATLEGPNKLGRFLQWLPEQRPDLRIHLLKWDLGMFQALGRGMTPLFILDLVTTSRLQLKLDAAHPAGAAHHQKIIVIDDCLAFCGGIDMTVDRWDTREHLDGDRRRVQPNGRAYPPWHDATAAVDGEAARAIGDLARERWRLASKDQLQPISDPSDAWPEDLRPTFEHVDVAIARTLPVLGDRREVREIEGLYLAAFARARDVIYIESQYLASRTLAEALARRLREADGPEILLVLPKEADGWLEQKAMDGARRKLLHLLWNADQHKRLGVYYPVTQGGEPIYVHAKIMIVDDWLLRVGSSNLNNRSMGFDTECDMAVEVTSGMPDEAQTRETIEIIRRDLLCEHLEIEAERFVAALKSCSGSLLNAVESLRGAGRTLEPLRSADVADDDSVLAENEFMDPEGTPPRFTEQISRGISDAIARIRSRGQRRRAGRSRDRDDGS
jgi:phosphatidylserine/phosphatidylglycerophosphate/cardiolipin synthase-like enzyme